MSIKLSEVEKVQTLVFAENLDITTLQSYTGKTWQQTVNNLYFQPEFAIVRCISYVAPSLNGIVVDYNNYIIQTNLSGGIDYIGAFNVIGPCVGVGGGITGSTGSINNPQTLIKIEKPINNVMFTILTPSQTFDATLMNTSSFANQYLTGQLVIVVDFIKLKNKK